ncbi:MAG TPA: efflux transporter outer membrane subunit [Planctomycetota bacterium]|nr:efflux transporter outer membrane subunit [Planctomycetota bacterium]
MIPVPSPLRRTTATLLLAFAASCTVGPDYKPPEVTTPAAYREAGTGLSADAADLTQWWKQLGDPLLDKLVERAANQSLDLKEALARVNELRALRGATAAELWPTVDARAGYQRRQDSENTPFGSFATDFDSYTAGIDASWELDLWGRVQRSIEAADADLQAEVETLRGVLVSVIGEVAANYVQLRSLQERVVIAQNNLALQERTLALVEARFSSGLVTERDVAQARANVSATRARVPALEIDARAAENRLAVLLGMAPGALAAELAAAAPIPVPPVRVAVGVPSDVVRRRPDIRAAERQLAAETARIGVAEGDLYPRLSLFGTFGFESDEVKTLFDGDSFTMGVGPAIKWNIFDAGGIRNRIAAQDARTQQALARWERTVLVAVEEVENAMTGFVREQVRVAHLREAATQARRAAEVASAQYTAGLTDFQNVVDFERATAELEDQLTQSRALITNNLIALYRALGGGWESG